MQIVRKNILSESLLITFFGTIFAERERERERERIHPVIFS
jgi:hypothetical protein